MKDPQESREKMREKTLERIADLATEYVQMFIEEFENRTPYCLDDGFVYVELKCSNTTGRTMISNYQRSEEFSCKAIYEAAERLNKEKGYKVKVKEGNLFTRQGSRMRRIVGKVYL